MSATLLDKLDGLSAYARRMLERGESSREPPIRAEQFGAQRFAQHGRTLARAQPIQDSGRGDATFFPRVEQNLDALRRAYDYVALTSRSGRYVSPAAEWLLDNFHLVEAQLQQIREGVPRGYYLRLPKLSAPPLAGLPRIYGIAWAYVAHTDSVLNAGLFNAFLDSYQDVDELTLGEFWAFPTTLRVVLLENLRRVAEHIAGIKVAREVAHAAWDRAARLDQADLDALDALMSRHGLRDSYLVHLWQRLPVQQQGGQAPALAQWTALNCPDGARLLGAAYGEAAADNVTVGNIIGTLRGIGQVQWWDWIEPVSRPLRCFRALPSFALESEISRQQIIHAVERVARESRRSEHEVARAVVALAQTQPAPDADAVERAAMRTAGYFLSAAGAARLREALAPAGTAAPAAPDSARSAQTPSWRLTAYLAALAAGTALVLAGLAHAVHRIDWQGGVHAPWPLAVALVLAAVPASEAVVALVHRILAESLRVSVLPRLDYRHGIPADQRVLVVIPTLLTSAQGAVELAQRLERHWLANREPSAQFALLTDFPDAGEQQLPGDAALLDAAMTQIDALNARHRVPDGQPTRFVLLHRPRQWSETEGRWIGWERKRGKLEMLLRLLARADASGFLPMPPAWTLAPSIAHVLTLDSDTILTPGALRELVATAAHPLNRPRVDRKQGRVVAGFGILQPHVITPFADDAGGGSRSAYHWIFAGQCGIDPYASGASNIYQDLFGRGSFTGKGLLDVQAVHAVLDARVPAGRVLSHDLLEGEIARTALMSDVALLEEQPQHAGVAASRIHRWTRGDWQLLPIIARARRYGIDALGRWKMLDNLRRSLVAPASMALLVWVVFTAAMPLGWALALVGAALALGPLLSALAALVPSRRGIEWAHFLDVGAADLLRALAGAGWQFVQLLSSARLLADAGLRALWRMAVSRRHLLQWTPSAQAQAQAGRSFRDFLRADAATAALGAAGTVVALASGPGRLAGAALFALWMLAPVLSWWGSARRARHAAKPQEAQRAYLTRLAQDTWRFFEHIVGEEDNHLPPDNLQLDPQPTVAHRSSPTNMGIYLLSACCAQRFGWIDTPELARRLALTLGTLERMPKHAGHLYNWYDTRTLEVLQPAYVSSVDSGNLAGHLLCVASACRALGHARESAAPDDARAGVASEHRDLLDQLEQLADRAEALCHAMDFRGLYDPGRHLFHIGLRVGEQALDASYYDLLASESRLLSYVAIAKGDVPLRHWSALGRPFLSVGVQPGLKSWSGSMFEYLMPALVMPEPAISLLESADRSAIREQQVFGGIQGLPWGVSESAYFGQDHTLAYQYSPFGVPRLALRRTPPTDRVVAPYASAMAAAFVPAEATANLRRLQALGARGEFGFFDAVDFTLARQPEGQAFSVVRSHMAHHQGMSLVALCNLLCENAPRRWFAQSPLMQAYDSLLHERTPRQIVGSPDPRQPPASDVADALVLHQPRVVDPRAPGLQPTQLLSNGRYTVALRANGAGVSRWRSNNVTRWRDDPLRDDQGTFIYLCEAGGPVGSAPVSLTALPAPGQGWRYRTRFLADQVQFDARGDGLHARTSVLISPEDDTELRTLALHNQSEQTRTFELISYLEPVLSPPKADEAHPAFANLFVTTRWDAQQRALLLERTPRLAGDASVCMAHFLASVEGELLSVEGVADRRSFVGRNGSLAQPALQVQVRDSGGQPLNGLDPIAGLRVRIRVQGGATARVTFATSAGDAPAGLLPVIDRYAQPMHVERALRMAATLAQVRLRDVGIEPSQIVALQDLTTVLTYTTPRVVQETGLVDLKRLWRFGISGDKPIVLVHIHAAEGLRLLHVLLRAQPWWGFGGVACDLVVINSEADSYLMPLQREIEALRARVASQVQNSFPRNDAAGFYLLGAREISAEERIALAGLARVVFAADGRPLELQVAALREGAGTAEQSHGSAQRPAPAPEASAPAGTSMQALPVPMYVPSRAPHGGGVQPVQGSFDADSGEFRFVLGAGQHTPRPWINVLSNPNFGCQVSESGAGFTWAGNSRMHQLTPWSNDPVRDPPFEHWLLQDLEGLGMLPLTPAGRSEAPAAHQVRHGQGYSIFSTTHDHGLSTECTVFVDLDEPVKLVRVVVRNGGRRVRRLRAIGMVEWQMGPARGQRRTLVCSKDAELAAVYARQREGSGGFGGATGLLMLQDSDGIDTGQAQWTCERGEFFRPGDAQPVLPAQLDRREGAGLDACGALAAELSVAPGALARFCFVLGHAESPASAQELAQRWRARDPGAALQRVRGFWDELLGRIQVRTPDPLFDVLINRWLPYQTLACRLWAKAGFYQAGGAFGFRDQLQDAMAFAISDPARLRAQILVNAARQFPEGDVQHWWHMPGGAGVRTHFSDDLLWLPYACAHYVATSGDTAILEETLPFLEGPAIPEGAEDAYYEPRTSEQRATLYEHCARAIDRSLRTGQHGLPLMGTGDWNDGMNRVGHEGRGESVWLGWFLCDVVQRFAPLAQARPGEAARAARWQTARQGWIEALHGAGWDGEWFRRAFFDDGTPLGSARNEECRIDLIAQAWSVLSGAGREAQVERAMASLQAHLSDPQAHLLRLLHPPLTRAHPSPGYIQAYPPGVRENGGQYSHGAVWALMAQALRGDTAAAWRSFTGLSPAHRAAHPHLGPLYEIEPYVMPGDTYSAAPYAGRGGWSWYTGSAAWLYRAAVETLFGVEIEGGRFRISPRLPPHWAGAELSLRLGGREIRCRYVSGGHPTAASLSQPDRDGAQWIAPGEWIALEALTAPFLWIETPRADGAAPPTAGP